MEYHSHDFSWDEWAEEAQKLLEDKHTTASSAHVESAAASWDDFFRTHSAGTFYKRRSYLPLEFPELAGACEGFECRRVLEIGSGYGCSMQPVLEANEGLEHYIATDISQSAIDILERNKPEAVSCHQWDATLPMPAALQREAMDCVLMVFALSAVQPEHHITVLQSAMALLRPGGMLCFRDYGLYDMTMLRHNKQLGDRLFLRAEGTLAFYFDLEHIRELAVAAGFEVLELEFCTVNNVNRRKGTVMRRVFVHAKLQKPLER